MKLEEVEVRDTAKPLDVVVPGYIPPAVPPTPEQRASELERLARDYIARARKQDAIARYEAYCPPEYKSYDRNHPVAAANMENINRILSWKYGKRGLLVTGPTGVNKTRSLWGLTRRLAHDDGVDFRYYNASDWLSGLHECVKYGRDEAKGWVDKLGWCPLVIIDDWGQEATLKSREDWAQAWFFRFLDLRIERGLPVVMTTNLKARDIAERSDAIRGDPLIRRMLEIMDVVNFWPQDRK